MTVLVCGASSQIGRFLLPRLAATGAPVLALSRQAQPALAGVTWLRGALPDALPALPVLSAVISFGPLPALAAWLACQPLPGAPRVVATSSMSAQSKLHSPVAHDRDLARQLLDGEHALAQAGQAHGFAWTVLRPTLVYGAGLDRSLTPLARRARRLRVFPLPRGCGLRQPVHADDVASAALAALACPASAGQVLSIGGGERLPAAAMFARVCASLPGWVMPLPVPRWALRCARVVPQWRGPIGRLDADLIADNSALETLLGIHPRPFAPQAVMWD